MSKPFPERTDQWVLEGGPRADIVISSRARLARNLPKFPFAPRANREQLEAIVEAVEQALSQTPSFEDYRHWPMTKLSTQDRRFLRESHLISTDFEKGRDGREVYLGGEARTSIMVNEEDHLRLQTMLAGLRLLEVYENIAGLERELESTVEFAYSPQFGYLTACPTNTGTGLRVSVLVHLVGLVMTNQIDDALGSLANFGLIVRGPYGEHSSPAGDLFQISNELTLGKSEEELIEILGEVVGQIVERESQARDLLFKHAAVKCEDAVLRALGVLSFARSIDSSEAVTLLSRIRLGVGREGFEIGLTHEQLNRLLIDVQPAHLRSSAKAKSTEEGDIARAALLRTRFSGNGASRN